MPESRRKGWNFISSFGLALSSSISQIEYQVNNNRLEMEKGWGWGGGGGVGGVRAPNHNELLS